VATESGPELRAIVVGKPRPLRPDCWDEVYRIGREALVNALRHAKARLVEIELHYDRRGIRILVRDDGVGIDAEVLRSGRAGHFGLTGMRERAERVGARFSVRSAKDAGTEIDVWVRGAVAFRSSPAAGLVERIRRRLTRLPHGRAEARPATDAGDEAR
jgi:signal transduction histidine kinase